MMSDNLEEMQTKWEAIYDEAWEFYSMEEFDKAEVQLDRCIKLSEEMGPKGEKLLGIALNLVAGVLCATDKPEEALETNLKAMEILDRHMEEKDEHLASVHANAAGLYMELERYEEALPHYIRTVQLREKSQGKDHPDIARDLAAMGLIHASMNDNEKAEDVYKAAMEQAKRDSLGESMPEIAECCAHFYFTNKRHDDCFNVLDEAIEALHESFSKPFRPDTKDPDWIMDYWTARNVVLRQQYQEAQIEPPMIESLKEIKA